MKTRQTLESHMSAMILEGKRGFQVSNFKSPNIFLFRILSGYSASSQSLLLPLRSLPAPLGLPSPPQPHSRLSEVGRTADEIHHS